MQTCMYNAEERRNTQKERADISILIGFQRLFLWIWGRAAYSPFVYFLFFLSTFEVHNNNAAKVWEEKEPSDGVKTLRSNKDHTSEGYSMMETHKVRLKLSFVCTLPFPYSGMNAVWMIHESGSTRSATLLERPLE